MASPIDPARQTSAGTGHSFTEVQLTGPADAVAQLMATLSGVSEVIFGPVVQPARDGQVTSTAQVVTHASPGAVADGQRVSVTVQSVLDVAPGTLTGSQPAQRMEEAVTDAVRGLTGVQEARTRVVAAVGLPAAQE
ncbi:hypothetical protein OG458_42420 (plasmid) [Streptomyces sp. NBC_01281]|uniref:hypothetical protein n=1 Tax=Streptomyces sp. NBC_01281 TaxID=2903811 RepID=UPI002E159066|nr:hypothetical protein OG458_41385 [Streptomyces sp. NBC_01281]WSK66612.1 hypothetical protein OG458_42420 [Streptomyces sp. NBC_01281]